MKRFVVIFETNQHYWSLIVEAVDRINAVKVAYEDLLAEDSTFAKEFNTVTIRETN